MGSSIEATVLAALEQAEMAARERRLAAATQAESILAAAHERAATIAEQAVRRVEEAEDELRRVTEAQADATIADLERSAAPRSDADTGPGSTDFGVEQAVATVAAHVLGEAILENDDGERT